MRKKTWLIILALICIIASIQAQDGTVIITPEMKSVLKKDPAWQLIERINVAALKNPCWNKHFQRAHYQAFLEEGNKYALELLKKCGLVK